jgi:hypothetical protein
MRQPRVGRPADPAPLSPSGSLWEPVSRDPGAASEPTDYWDHDYDGAGRPFFAWDRESREADSNE